LSVQYARGVAAVSVVLFHAFNDAGVTHYPEQVLQAGVDLFFAISGFIMWVTTFGSGIGSRAFLGKRIRRIVPLYWLFTAFAVSIAVIAPQLGKRTGIGDAIASFLFLPAQNTATHAVEPVIAPGWTLNHEMLFYVIFAVALILPAVPRFVAVIGLNVALVLVGLVFHSPLVVSFYSNPIILEFVFGVAVGWIYTSGRSASRRVSTAVVACGALAMIGLAAAWGQEVWLRVVVWGLPAAVILLALALTENFRSVRLRPRWLFVGDASYSIYIVHGVFLSALFALIKHAGVPKIAMIPLGAPAAVICGMLVYRYIERPITRQLKGRRRTPVTIPAPLVRAEVAGSADA
jgi:peptidoglycan/LPS O-acetylase OafA/YrhL